MTEQALPPAGWYPDPEIEGCLRWWDGVAWRSSQEPARRPGSAPAVRALGVTLVGLLAVHLVGNVLMLVTYLWALTPLASGYGRTWLDGPLAYDLIEMGASAIVLTTLLAMGVIWCTWQYKLARLASLDGTLRRSAGMHAGSWFIPVVWWWFPFQNMRDLWRSFVARPAGGLLGWWWACWIVANLTSRVLTRLVVRGDPSWSSYNVVAAADAALWVLTGGLAMLVVLRLNRAAAGSD